MIKIIEDHFEIYCLAISPDERYLACGLMGKNPRTRGDDDMVWIWDISDGNLVRMIESIADCNAVTKVSFSRDRKRLISRADDGIVKVWSFSTGELIISLGHEEYIRGFSMSPDGNCIICIMEDRKIMVWDFLTGNLIKEIWCNDYVSKIEVTPDGNYIVGACWDTIKIWELSSGKCVWIFDKCHDEVINYISITPNGKIVLSGSKDSTIKAWKISY